MSMLSSSSSYVVKDIIGDLKSGDVLTLAYLTEPEAAPLKIEVSTEGKHIRGYFPFRGGKASINLWSIPHYVACVLHWERPMRS